MNYRLLEEELHRDEGLRLKPYKCTAGKWTIGVGHKMSPSEIRDVHEISVERAGELLQQDIGIAAQGAVVIFGRERFDSFSDSRQRALINMIFQMGTDGVSGFHNMVGAIMHNDWVGAQHHALDSKWAKKDTPERARRVAAMLLNG